MSAAQLREAIVDRIERYLDTWRSGDLAARRRVFSPHAVLEDPVGTPPVVGLDRIEAHWAHLAADGAAYEATLRRVVVCGHEALLQYALRTEPPHGPGSVTEIFATVVFDSALEIRALRCWIDESCVHVLG
jgi:ketosteroid isomerase-like protein